MAKETLTNPDELPQPHVCGLCDSISHWLTSSFPRPNLVKKENGKSSLNNPKSKTHQAECSKGERNRRRRWVRKS